MPQWDGPYMPKDIPQDPWGHPYVYKFPGEHGEEPGHHLAAAPTASRAGEGNNADIVSWKNK